MQTLTVEITNENALKVLQDLHQKHHIKILPNPDLNSPVFPGEPFTETEFQEWIAVRENSETLSLPEAKNEWAKKRDNLLNQGK